MNIDKRIKRNNALGKCNTYNIFTSYKYVQCHVNLFKNKYRSKFHIRILLLFIFETRREI